MIVRSYFVSSGFTSELVLGMPCSDSVPSSKPGQPQSGSLGQLEPSCQELSSGLAIMWSAPQASIASPGAEVAPGGDDGAPCRRRARPARRAGRRRRRRSAAGATPMRRAASSSGAGCGFACGVVSPQTSAAARVARPSARDQRLGETRRLVGDDAPRQRLRLERGRAAARLSSKTLRLARHARLVARQELVAQRREAGVARRDAEGDADHAARARADHRAQRS